MDDKLKELTNKIYREGVEKAKSDGQEIVDKAKNEASAILAAARKEAESIVNGAQKEAEQLRTKTVSELKMASGQSIETLKQEIVNLLSNSIVKDGVKKSVEDVEFVKSLIKEITTNWDNGGKSLDLSLMVPEKFKKDFDDFVKGKTSDILSKGVEIKFEERMDGGFKIGPKDSSFVLSFTDKDFMQFFQSFLKPKTKEILF
ncbi:MAG TPA: V-type ATP synthase subunit E [Spirochaetota bacterium]|nr:V-type ATP synthase subunit E [Spirochaetota bacterium]